MSNWSKVTIGSISTVRKGISYKSEEYCTEEFGNPFITIKCFVKGGGYEPSGLKYLDGIFTKADELIAGDILFSATDLTRAGDIVGSPLRVPNFGEDCIAIASTDCMKIEFNTNICDKDFMYHRMMLSDIRQKMVAYSAGSTVLHLDTKQVLKFTICIPKQVATQKKIARILDTIDRTITYTEALIEKYQQIKAGLMHDLFTRGIGADGKLRPPRDKAPELYQESSIGWIPKEWDIVFIGDITERIEQGWSPDCESEVASLSEWGVLKTSSVQWDGFYRDANKRLPNNLKPKIQYKVFVGDLIITRAGPNSRVGVVSIVRKEPGNLLLSDKLYRLILKSKISYDYVLLALLSENTQRFLGGFKTGLAESQTNISQSIVKKLIIALPSKEEQANFVEREELIRVKIDMLKDDLFKHQKIKSGLMHDLLTGKVQVNIDPV